MNKMYIESDNSGRSIFINIGKSWYYVDCAPNGKWGDVDIIEGTEEEAAKRIREAINNEECYGIEDCESDIEGENPLYRHIPEYDGMTARQIEEYEQETTLTEI